MQALPLDPPAGGLRKLFDALGVALFLAALCAPTIDGFVRPDSARSPQIPERRYPEPRPEMPSSGLDWLRFPERYQAFHKDSFGLRDKLLRWNSVVQVFGLGVSPNPEVYLGKHHWPMFGGDLALANRRGKLPFDEDQLQRWVEALKTRRARLAAAGVRYVYVVAPDKESVYAEFLPDSVHAIGPTRLEQWLARLASEAPEVEVLDLRAALIAHKRQDREGDWLYNAYGTHWSGRGSLVAVRALLERLRAMGLSFDAQRLDEFRRQAAPGLGDSFADSLYIGDLMQESIYEYVAPQARARVSGSEPSGRGRIRIAEIDDPSLPRVLLLHDSFGLYVEGLLGELCSYLQGNWSASLDMQELARIDPDVVIDLHVERTLNHISPLEFLPIDAEHWRARFEASKEVLLAPDRTQPNWGLAAVGQLLVGPASAEPSAGLPILVRDRNDKLGLPALSTIQGEVPVARLLFESPAEGRVTLWYRPPGETRFLRRSEYSASSIAGRNEMYLPLSRPGTGGELLLRLGESPGEYRLLDLEIRSVQLP